MPTERKKGRPKILEGDAVTFTFRLSEADLMDLKKISNEKEISYFFFYSYN